MTFDIDGGLHRPSASRHDEKGGYKDQTAKSSGLSATGTVKRRLPICLVVEDDDTIRHLLTSYLEEHDIRTVSASRRDEVSRILARSEPDMVILDLRLGQEDGLDLLREIRTQSDVPVIITTGQRRDEIDRVIGLELGADDYITRPFGLRELLARIRGLLRRREIAQVNAQRDREKGRCRFGGWQLDLRNRRLTNPTDEPVALTKSEYALLIAFLDAPLRPLSREHLLQATRIHEDVFDRSIDVQVLRLRRKLKTDPSTPSIIRTKRGRRLRLLASRRTALTTALKAQPMIHQSSRGTHAVRNNRSHNSQRWNSCETCARHTTLTETSMPVAKHLSYIRLRSRADRPQRIDGPSFAYFSTRHNPCRARAQRTSSEVPAIVATPAAPRSIVRSIAQFAETAGKILIVVATWLLSEILAGWAAHALAMYGLPVAIEEPGDTTACKPSDASVHPPQPAPHVISVVAEADIKTDNFSMPDVGRCAVAHPATPAFRPHELGEQS